MDLLKCLLFKITRENLQDHKWNYKVDLQIYKRKVKLFNNTLLAPYLPDFPKKVLNVVLECLISMFGVNVWYQCLVSMFGVNVWCQCLISMLGVNVWWMFGVNVFLFPFFPTDSTLSLQRLGPCLIFIIQNVRKLQNRLHSFALKYLDSIFAASENLQKKMWIW